MPSQSGEPSFISSLSCASVAATLGADVKTLGRERTYRIMLYICMAVYIAVGLERSFFRYDHFASTGFDLAIFDQATWLISHGQTPFVTVRGLHIMADHFSAVLYLIAPLYWLWNSPKVLLTVQTVALGMGALPVHALARQKIKSAPIALLFAIAYLLFPALQWANLCEFHPDTLAIPMLLGAFLMASLRRWRSYFVLLAVAVLTKETVGLTIMLLGVYLLRQDKRIGWCTIIFGVVSLAIAILTLQHFSHTFSSSYLWLYRYYGDSAYTISAYILCHPFAVFADCNTEQARTYLFQLLQPVAFLPLLAPDVLWIVTPALLTNLFSSRLWMLNIYGWYTALIVPFLFVSAIVGFTRCQRYTRPVQIGCLIYFIGSVLFGLTSGPFCLHPWPVTHGLLPAQAAEVADLLRFIPPESSVCAPTVALPHLSHRKSVYVFPNPFYQTVWGATRQALAQEEGEGYAPMAPAQCIAAANSAPTEYVMLFPQPLIVVPDAVYHDLVSALLHSRKYGVIAIRQETLLLKRGADHEAGLRLFAAQAGVPIRQDKDIDNAYQVWKDKGFLSRETYTGVSW